MNRCGVLPGNSICRDHPRMLHVEDVLGERVMHEGGEADKEKGAGERTGDEGRV